MRETQLAKHFETLMCRLQSLIPIFMLRSVTYIRIFNFRAGYPQPHFSGWIQPRTESEKLGVTLHGSKQLNVWPFFPSSPPHSGRSEKAEGLLHLLPHSRSGARGPRCLRDCICRPFHHCKHGGSWILACCRRSHVRWRIVFYWQLGRLLPDTADGSPPAQCRAHVHQA